ncbi:Glycosyltransferase Family 15 protein [Tuber magnatum]|uniref:Glycosyltransferase Family 15 protein n=1 Tax=Tuber magnatum TaxID=42249 RepID=A0A317T226_9PEZI|nr:Glycosyltransferase Family 15 protein [Tuber magnatum]
MGLVSQLVRRIPLKAAIPSLEDISRGRLPPRLSFLRRRIRLKGNSSISIPLGVVLLFPVTVILLITLLFYRHPDNRTSILIPSGSPPAIRRISEIYDKPFVVGCLEPVTDTPRVNAAFVVLARNSELEGVIQSVKSIERHFNRWYNYPYVFLNDEEFNATFKSTIINYTSGTVEFGSIPKTMWGFPDWVDKDEATESIAKQGDAAIMYGGMASYHHMCRFYSGFFYKHELLAKYEWYWRLEPEIKYFCDITYDPFLHMQRQNKTYGFTIAVKELKETVPNIFRYASAYKRNSNLPTTEAYNMCHFWSNFEIARLDFFRSEKYEKFFETMDRSGGFWTERWGDAPIHSLAAGVLLEPSDIHYFRDFGYRHTTIQHCPANAPARQLPRLKWLEKTTTDPKKAKEEDDYWENWDSEKENGVGCRCRCDTDIVDVEGKQGSCLSEWVNVAGGWTSA